MKRQAAFSPGAAAWEVMLTSEDNEPRGATAVSEQAGSSGFLSLLSLRRGVFSEWRMGRVSLSSNRRRQSMTHFRGWEQELLRTERPGSGDSLTLAQERLPCRGRHAGTSPGILTASR